MGHPSIFAGRSSVANFGEMPQRRAFFRMIAANLPHLDALQTGLLDGFKEEGARSQNRMLAEHSSGPFTLFAPVNEAFKQDVCFKTDAEREALLKDPVRLKVAMRNLYKQGDKLLLWCVRSRLIRADFTLFPQRSRQGSVPDDGNA